jgi:CubicO group peptidase (beta-lactamase class C family)
LSLSAHVSWPNAVCSISMRGSRYWPEFAQNAKADVTVSHLLAHASGLFGFAPESKIGADAALDWDACTRALERMQPLWVPGTAYLYHFITYRYLLGEVLRRASGKSFAALFRENIATPLRLDLWMGLPDTQDHRVAPHIRSNTAFSEAQLVAFKGLGLDTNSRLVRTLIFTMTSTEDLIALLLTRAGRAAVIPAANAIGSARSLARMYAACIGQIDDVRLLSAAAITRASVPQTDHLNGPPPLVIRGGAPQRFGLGFELRRETLPMLGPDSFGHPGAGGRLAFAHPEKGYAVAYACNNLVWDGQSPDPRWIGWLSAPREIAPD